MYHHLLCGLSLSKKKTGHPFLKMCIHSISRANTIATVFTLYPRLPRLCTCACMPHLQAAKVPDTHCKTISILLCCLKISRCVMCGKYHTSSTLIRPTILRSVMASCHYTQQLRLFFNFRLYNALNFVQKYTK